MHELSLAMEVCRLAEERLTGLDGRLVGVGVRIGPDAGVEIGSFRFCLETLLDGPPFGGVAVELLPGPADALRLDYLEVDDGCPDD